jgi:hypothetical protein
MRERESEILLKRYLGKASQFAAVQPVRAPHSQELYRADAYLQVLADSLPIELVCHAWQLDLTMQRLVAYT